MWKTVLKIISNLISTLLFLLLVFTVFAVISVKASGGEPSAFGYQLKSVLSGSMEPEIQTGSIIAIKEVDNHEQFEKGDVITFTTKDGIHITHRIVEVQGDGESYITKGDNNNGPDVEPVLAQNVVGQYTGFTIPYVGYIVNFANSKEGAALLLILPGLLLIGYAAVTIWRALKQLETPTETKSTTGGE